MICNSERCDSSFRGIERRVKGFDGTFVGLRVSGDDVVGVLKSGVDGEQETNDVTMQFGRGSCNFVRLEFVAFLLVIGCTDGYLDLFISQSQVKKLLGEYLRFLGFLN